MGCCYTYDYCARVMELFSFGNDKFKVLQIMGNAS